MPSKRVTLYPVEGAYIAGVAATITEVDADEAERLLAYDPPAFTKEPPKADQTSAAPAEPTTEV